MTTEPITDPIRDAQGRRSAELPMTRRERRRRAPAQNADPAIAPDAASIPSPMERPRGRHAAPPPADWASVATALLSLRQIATPLVLRVDVDGSGPLLIDPAAGAFSWSTPLSDFPEHPSSIRVSTVSRLGGDTFTASGQELDALLWLIGQSAFPASFAPWLRLDDRYRLTRWPDILGVVRSMDQLRMIAMLGNAALTPQELADAAGATLDEPRRLLNAVSLMGILVHEPRVDTVPPALPAAASSAVAAPHAPTGLFRRLRDRLGL